MQRRRRRSRQRRGAPWLLALLASTLAAGGWVWLDANFERQLRTIPVGASHEVRANPFLAAERFLRQSGMDARSSSGMALLRELPSPGDLLVVDGLPALNAARQAQLRGWIAAGGHLLVEAVELPHDDDTGARADFLAGFGAALQREASADADAAVATLRLPGYADPLRVAFAPRWSLQDRSGEAAVLAVADERPRLLAYRVGAGRLLVVSDTQWLGNEVIGQYDHAMVLALLAADRDSVWLLHDVSLPPLALLLWQRAPAALISAPVLLVLLLWHLGRRLGPLLPAAAAGRRDLMEHLEAAGEFIWRQGRGGLLVAQTRDRLERRWLERHPTLKALDKPARARQIAAQMGLSEASVQAALYDPVVDAAGLVRFTATLQRLAQVRPPTSPASRKQQPRATL